jgi:hypothetical protein
MRLCRRCTGLADVGEDLIDDGWVGDICDDPQVAATGSRGRLLGDGQLSPAGGSRSISL